VKKALIILVNTVLVLVIIGVILATWMPAIYTSDWFQKTDWPSVYHTGVVRGRQGLIWLVVAAVVIAMGWFGAVALLKRRRAETSAIPGSPAAPRLPTR
jgi:uncharacterized membrane protein (UPF0182 family)